MVRYLKNAIDHLLKMKQLLTYFLILTIALFSCKKETPEEPVAPQPLKAPVYEPGDTTFGAAYAEKGSHLWLGEVYCKTAFLDSTKLGIKLFAYSSQGFLREIVGLGAVDKNAPGSYRFHNNTLTVPPPGFVLSSYSTVISDGDVLEDHYRTDSTDASNHLTITHIDLVNKRIEGRFHAAFDLQPPRRNPANPLKATFANGRFWALIRD
jgi:hypothetical protein